jgi:ABC-type uncharacterized transport system permease subunit
MKYIAVILLVFGAGYGGAFLAEASTDHQQVHIDKMEARWR